MTWSEIKPSKEERSVVLGAARRNVHQPAQAELCCDNRRPQPQLASHNHSVLPHRHCGSGWLSRRAVLHVPLKGESPHQPPPPLHLPIRVPC